MTPLLLTIPLTLGDLPLVRSLLAHLAHLSPPANHGVLFVADHTLAADAFQPILDQAKPLFLAGGQLIRTPLAITPAYPHGANHRFETAAKHIAATRRVPWLWLDPRCVPTRKSWLLDLEREYFASHKPFMGQLLTPAAHGTAATLLSSTAIYPADLPKRILQRLVSQRDRDFEQSCADLLVPLAHSTALIWTHPRDGSEALPVAPAGVAVVHTAMAREYAASLRGEAAAVTDKSCRTSEPPIVLPLATPPPASSRAAYYHSGNLGDVIYALAAIKLAGGGRLLLGPRQKRTSPAGNPIKREAFDLLAPLLRAQPYLAKVDYHDTHPGRDAAFDLNTFRNHWNDRPLRARLNVHTLVAMHAYTLGVLEKWHPSLSWLSMENPITSGLFAVHRSARYQTGADGFPWTLVVKRFRSRLLFVGLASEHAAFQREFRVRTAFWSCTDFLELARVIAGARGFIGNQSFPCALALALNQRVLQESWPQSPDCVLARGNFATQPLSEAALAKWEESR